MSSTGSKILAHFLGVLAFALVGLLVAILYMLVIGKLLHLGGDGFGIAASIVTFPLLALTSCLFCWLPLWFLHHRRGPSMSAGRAVFFGALLGLLIGFLIGGPRGFLLSGGSPLFNYFVMLMLALGALAHRFAVVKVATR